MVQCKSGGKDIKGYYAKEKLRESIGQSEFKKETLRNRKEDFRSEFLNIRRKVLKNCKSVSP
jgi:hypothetical protein